VGRAHLSALVDAIMGRVPRGPATSPVRFPTGQHLERGVWPHSAGYGGDEAVHQPRGATPAAGIAGRCAAAWKVSCHIERQEIEAEEEPTKVSFPLFITRSSNDLHEHRISGSQRAMVRISSVSR
jgi:hypothetical protein